MMKDSEATEEETEEYMAPLVWRNILKFLVLHLMFLFGLSLVPSLSWPSLLWLGTTYLYSGAGITAGAHRLWSHSTYKARLPLRSEYYIGASGFLAQRQLDKCVKFLRTDLRFGFRKISVVVVGGGGGDITRTDLDLS